MAVFAVQNAVSVSLNFAVWTMQTNLVIVILGFGPAGCFGQPLFFYPDDEGEALSAR